jgi:hypothetical protein
MSDSEDNNENHPTIMTFEVEDSHLLYEIIGMDTDKYPQSEIEEVFFRRGFMTVREELSPYCSDGYEEYDENNKHYIIFNLKYPYDIETYDEFEHLYNVCTERLNTEGFIQNPSQCLVCGFGQYPDSPYCSKHREEINNKEKHEENIRTHSELYKKSLFKKIKYMDNFVIHHQTIEHSDIDVGLLFYDEDSNEITMNLTLKFIKKIE